MVKNFAKVCLQSKLSPFNLTKVSIGQVTQYSVSLKRTHEKFSASRPPGLLMIPGLNNEQIVKGLPEREFYGLSNGTFGFQIPTLVVEIFAFF